MLKIKEFVHDKNDQDVPLIFCGDLNSQPGGTVHSYLTKGKVGGANTTVQGEVGDEDTLAEMLGVLALTNNREPLMDRSSNERHHSLRVVEWLKKKDTLTCPFQFESAYGCGAVGEMCPFTNVTINFAAVIDYVLYQPERFRQTARLYMPASLDELQGDLEYWRDGKALPNDVWPSDHLAIGAELSF